MIDPDITMKEKKETLENDRKVRATYHSLAQADAGLDRGGRFSALDKPTVTGSDPAIRYPRQPSSSPWHSDPCGIEPPLGFSVEDQPAVGEPHEISKSLASAADAAKTPTPSVVGDSRGVGVNKPKWRRI